MELSYIAKSFTILKSIPSPLISLNYWDPSLKFEVGCLASLRFCFYPNPSISLWSHWLHGLNAMKHFCHYPQQVYNCDPLICSAGNLNTKSKYNENWNRKDISEWLSAK